MTVSGEQVMERSDPRADLAFMRAIVEAGDESLAAFGRIYFVAGLCYGVQCLLSGATMLGLVPDRPAIQAAIAVVPTIVFLAFLAWEIRRDRERPVTGNLATRAIGTVFACVGLTNLALIAAIGLLAWRRNSLEIWLIYPCVVMILQGMAWLFAWTLRRRLWIGAVAAGWFATGIAMAAALAAQSGGWYLTVVSFGLFAFMAAPGAWLMRPAPHA